MNKKIRYAFSLDCKNDVNLTRYLNLERIYKFYKHIAICINKIKTQMYNTEKICIFLSKNTKTQTISVEEIHNTTGLITIFGSKSLTLYS